MCVQNNLITFPRRRRIISRGNHPSTSILLAESRAFAVVRETVTYENPFAQSPNLYLFWGRDRRRHDHDGAVPGFVRPLNRNKTKEARFLWAEIAKSKACTVNGNARSSSRVNSCSISASCERSCEDFIKVFTQSSPPPSLFSFPLRRNHLALWLQRFLCSAIMVRDTTSG